MRIYSVYLKAEALFKSVRLANSSTCLCILLSLIPALLFGGPRVELVPDCKARANGDFEPFWKSVREFIIEAGGTFTYTTLSDVKVGRKDNKKNVDAIIAWNLPSFIPRPKFYAIPREKNYLFLAEPPTVIDIQYSRGLTRHFKKIFTWNDDLVDNINYFKFRYPVLRPPINQEVPFKDKKMFCMVIGNKASKHPLELYSKRRAIIRALDKSGEFDLYGTGWGNEFSSYRGPVDDKVEVASRYKFAFCLENMGGIKGYITEKIFDAFASLTVPIYEGASNITEEIPANCFIDLREFASLSELVEWIKSMPEENYNEYIENIKNFLKSDLAEKYSERSFCKTIFKEIFLLD